MHIIVNDIFHSDFLVIEFTLKQLFLFYFMYWFILPFHTRPTSKYFMGFGCPIPHWPMDVLTGVMFLACTYMWHEQSSLPALWPCIEVPEMYFSQFPGNKKQAVPLFFLYLKMLCAIFIWNSSIQRLWKGSWKTEKRQLTNSIWKAAHLSPQNYKMTKQLKQWDKWHPHCGRSFFI